MIDPTVKHVASVPDITMSPEVVFRELKLIAHDEHCEFGPNCTTRLEDLDAFDELLPLMLKVANFATQIALIHLTVKYDLSPSDAVDYGLYPAVNWGALITQIDCEATTTLANGQQIECEEKGVHPIHKNLTTLGVEVAWQPPESPTAATPEEAAAAAAMDDAHSMALMINDAFDRQAAVDAAEAEQAAGDDSTA